MNYINFQLGLFEIEKNPMAAAAVGLGKGHLVVDHLDMLHIIKCQPKMVTVRHTSECHRDLPVWHQGRPMFRDGKSHTLKNNSRLVDCKAECSHHKLWGAFYTSCPHFKRFRSNVTIEKVVPETFDEDEFEPKFYSLSSPYEGSAVQNALLVIFFATKRQTVSDQWLDDLFEARDRAEKNGRPHETWMESINSVFDMMKDINYLQIAVNKILNWAVYGTIAIIGVMFVTWIIAMFGACFYPRDNGPTLARLFLLPIVILWNGFQAWLDYLGLPHELPDLPEMPKLPRLTNTPGSVGKKDLGATSSTEKIMEVVDD